MPTDTRIRIGLVILALGTGPLVLYAILGPKDGNPIGLGLLFVFTFPFAMGFVLWSGAARLWNRLRGGTDASAAEAKLKPRVGVNRHRDHRDNWP